MMNRMHHTLSDRTTHVTSALARRDEHAADYNLVQAKLKKFLPVAVSFPCSLNNYNSPSGHLFVYNMVLCVSCLLGEENCLLIHLFTNHDIK